VSLPAVLTSSGVRDVVNLKLDKEEFEKLNESVQAMLKIQQNIKFDK
jgi:malate/lactate dehydrogenase